MIKKDPMMPAERREELDRISRQADAFNLADLHRLFGELGIKCACTAVRPSQGRGWGC